MEKCNIGIIGAGGIARAHLNAAKASGGRINVLAGVDPSETARRAVADACGAKTYASVEEFFAAESMHKTVDAVLVCTPPKHRLGIVRMALARGVHVMVEKPIASNVKDAKAMVDLAAKHPNLVCSVGYCHRFTPAMNEIRKCIDEGTLGEVLRFENTFACWFPAMKDKWFSDPAESGGGSFIDTGCHSLDLYQYLLGDAKVIASSIHHAWPGRGESTATVMLRGITHKSATGVIQSGWIEPARFIVSVVGTKGMLSYDYEKPTELTFKPSEGNPEMLPVETHELRFEKQLLAFAQAAQGKAPAGQLARFSDGLTVAQWVDDALKSE